MFSSAILPVMLHPFRRLLHFLAICGGLFYHRPESIFYGKLAYRCRICHQTALTEMELLRGDPYLRQDHHLVAGQHGRRGRS